MREDEREDEREGVPSLFFAPSRMREGEEDEEDEHVRAEEVNLFFHTLNNEPYCPDLSYFVYNDSDDEEDSENSITPQPTVAAVVPTVDCNTPKTTSPPRTFLPLPNSGTAPHIWDFNYTVDWRNEGFADSYWDIAFTFTCGTKQCRGFELGEMRLIASSSTFEPHCQCVHVTPSETLQFAITANCASLQRGAAFELYTEKHYLSKTVNFVLLFADEDARACFPHTKGTIVVNVDEATGIVSHRVHVNAIVIDPCTADTGGAGRVDDVGRIRKALSWAWYGGLAYRFKAGLDWVFRKLFTETNSLYNEASTLKPISVPSFQKNLIKTKGD